MRVGSAKVDLKNNWEGLPVGPVVETLPSNEGCVSSIPVLGAKIPTCLSAKKTKP